MTQVLKCGYVVSWSVVIHHLLADDLIGIGAWCSD